MSKRREHIQGTIYLIHMHGGLDRGGMPGLARHYIGWTEGPLDERITTHRKGAGARILRAASQRGISFEVVRTWSGDRFLERALKTRRNSPKLCPVCNPETAHNWASDTE